MQPVLEPVLDQIRLEASLESNQTQQRGAIRSPFFVFDFSFSEKGRYLAAGVGSDASIPSIDRLSASIISSGSSAIKGLGTLMLR